jgi:hypothetical protein
MSLEPNTSSKNYEYIAAIVPPCFAKRYGVVAQPKAVMQREDVADASLPRFAYRIHTSVTSRHAAMHDGAHQSHKSVNPMVRLAGEGTPDPYSLIRLSR